MNLTNDIYYKIDSNLLEQSFWELNIKEKKKLIDEELKKYIILKINTLNEQELINVEENTLSIEELLLKLSEKIPKENHHLTLNHFVHYILQVAGNLQNCVIIWWVDKNKTLITNPVVEFDENEIWNSLKTHEQTDYVQIFNFVYDVFKNKFMVTKNKKLILNKDNTIR